jgi:hypothetical protein
VQPSKGKDGDSRLTSPVGFPMTYTETIACKGQHLWAEIFLDNRSESNREKHFLNVTPLEVLPGFIQLSDLISFPYKPN